MDLFQLQCFVSIVDQKSFTAAAYEVAVSQSSLSKHISKLEDELHVKLFDRSRRSVQLTPAGIEFEGYARTILHDQVALLTAMRKYSNSATLQVGSIENVGRVGLATPIASFLHQFPLGTVNINIQKGDTRMLLGLLCAQRLDMAFIAQIASPFLPASNISDFDLSEYRLYPLIKDTYHVVVSEKHPFADREIITWQEIAQEKLMLLDQHYSINRIVRESMAAQGLFPTISFECDQVDTLLGLTEENYGVSLFSKKVVDGKYHIKSIPMENPLTRDTVLVVLRTLGSNQQLGNQFVRHIVNYYNSSEK